MATDPSFAVPKTWAGVTTTADTAFTTAPTNYLTLVTAGTSGSKIDQIRIQQLVTATICVCNFWLYDGTNNRIFESTILNGGTVTTSAGAVPIDFYYENLTVPNIASTAWQLRVTVTLAAGAAAYNVIAFGGDY